MKRWLLLALLVCSVASASDKMVRIQVQVYDSAAGTWVRRTLTLGTGFTLSEADSAIKPDTVSASAGSGDMAKSVYDTDGNGVVDSAEAAPGGTGSSFSWSVSGSAAASDSLRFHQAFGGTWTRIGNYVTYIPDTSTANTGLATVGDVARSRFRFSRSGGATTEDSARIQGTANEVDISQSGAAYTIGLPDSVAIARGLSAATGKFGIDTSGTVKKVGNLATAGAFGVLPVVASYAQTDNTADIDNLAIGSGILFYWIRAKKSGSGSYDFTVSDVDGNESPQTLVTQTVDMSGGTIYQGMVIVREGSMSFYPSSDGAYDFYAVVLYPW